MRYERIGFREEKSLNDKINDNAIRRKKQFKLTEMISIGS